MWKVYFWLLVVASLIGLPAFVFLGTIQAIDLVDLPLSLVSLVGLFAYAHRRSLGTQRFWRFWMPAVLLWDIAVLTYFVPQGLAYALPDSEPTTLAENVFSFALAVPLYAALYLYAFRSPELWEGSVAG